MFQYGRGIYSTPHVHLAEDYAKEFEWKGDTYKLVFQNRVNLAETQQIQIASDSKASHKGTYYLTENPENVRPYGLLIKKVKAKEEVIDLTV